MGNLWPLMRRAYGAHQSWYREVPGLTVSPVTLLRQQDFPRGAVYQVCPASVLRAHA